MSFPKRVALVMGLAATSVVMAGPVRADAFSCNYLYFVPDGSAAPLEMDPDNLSEWITTFYLSVSDDIHPGVWYWISVNGKWFVINDTWTSIPGGAVISSSEFSETYEALRGQSLTLGQSVHLVLAFTSSAVTKPNEANTYCNTEIWLRFGPEQESGVDINVDVDWNHYLDRADQPEALPSTR